MELKAEKKQRTLQNTTHESVRRTEHEYENPAIAV